MKKQNTVQTHKPASIRTYRFDFGSDDSLYSVSFKAAIPKSEINRMFASARSSAYENCSRAIRLYLDSHHLEYSDFISGKTLLKHHAVMAAADSLLHSGSCNEIDQWIVDADEYYAVMDYQKQMDENCEGCYFALSRTSAEQDSLHEYHVIGQLFQYHASCGKEHSYFAIRQGKSGCRLHTLDAENRCPVFATFGCVDVMALLLNIASITTLEQAAMHANK